MKQENDKPSPTDNSLSPTTEQGPSKALKCPSCHRIKAFLSTLGILGPGLQTDASCDKCALFEQLRIEMGVANAAFASLQDRRRDHVGRKEALRRKLDRQAAFVNFVDGELVVVDQNEEVDDKEQVVKVELPLVKQEPLSETSAAAHVQSYTQKRPLSPSLCEPTTRPTKRLHLHPAPPARTVTFAPSVVFRDENEYRSSGLLHTITKYISDIVFGAQDLRGEKDYVSGRYAPGSGSVWLDTSGYEQGFSRFYRVKWVGRRWVEVVDEEDEGESGCERGVGEGVVLDGMNGIGVGDGQTVEGGEEIEAGDGGKRRQLGGTKVGDGERGRRTSGCVDAEIDNQNPEDETSEEGCGV